MAFVCDVCIKRDKVLSLAEVLMNGENNHGTKAACAVHIRELIDDMLASNNSIKLRRADGDSEGPPPPPA